MEYFESGIFTDEIEARIGKVYKPVIAEKVQQKDKHKFSTEAI